MSRGDCASFHASACSRPPEPMRRTFMPAEACPPVAPLTKRPGPSRASNAGRKSSPGFRPDRGTPMKPSCPCPTKHPSPTPRSGNWVDRYLPVAWRPYARLARLDRPIGWWLLLWPCWWSSALAAGAAGWAWPNPWHLFLFLVGAIAMRGAGCTYNDIVDRDFDAKVARTRSRPIPSGQVTVAQARLFLARPGAGRPRRPAPVQPFHHPSRLPLARSPSPSIRS